MRCCILAMTHFSDEVWAMISPINNYLKQWRGSFIQNLIISTLNRQLSPYNVHVINYNIQAIIQIHSWLKVVSVEFTLLTAIPSLLSLLSKWWGPTIWVALIDIQHKYAIMEICQIDWLSPFGWPSALIKQMATRDNFFFFFFER